MQIAIMSFQSPHMSREGSPEGEMHHQNTENLDQDLPDIQLSEDEAEQSEGIPHIITSDLSPNDYTRPTSQENTAHLTDSRVSTHHHSDVESFANGPDETVTSDAPYDQARSIDESLISGPDDTPSVQGSIMSSPGSRVIPAAAVQSGGANSPGSGFLSQSFRPFDRRFTSRISSASSSQHSRPSSPALHSGHARNVSVTSQFMFEQFENESQSPPWDVVRWTKLKKLTGQAFSESGKRNFGSPTYLAVASSIFVGTTKGLILMFDYSQNLKIIIGSGTTATECGAITSIAISADHSTVAGGHANGSIFTWETSKATRPFLSIPPFSVPTKAERSSDGHVPNVSVIHLGFLGTRRTALVSADDRGMAFSHLATRGTGALGRTVKTTRILGRYPNTLTVNTNKPSKPSTVLAFAPLPLGNAERATDTMGLTAMLTPYLLVIVSTTPVAQTQHKAARPKDIKPHSTMTGCIAWFPAGKLKAPDVASNSDISKAKLVYCWSNILTIVDVDEISSENANKPASLEFHARNRWKCEEAIVAVQWLSRSVITVLTITQRLVVLEDRTMRVTDAFDLIHKYIYHADLFSTQLHSLVEQYDAEEHENGESMHGVVSDAFYMSFRSFKGRLFLLGFEDLSIGALSNWQDRLVALMANRDYVASIQLATSYYVGDSDKLTVGLPEDAEIRHAMITSKIFELMTDCLEHIAMRRKKNRDSVPVTALKDFVEAIFVACEIVGNTDFLFEVVYEWYEEHHYQGLFLETLESYILEDTITIVPPVVMKQLMAHYVAKGLETRLEEMICHVETATLDLDQITSLCKQHGLYDALIYVWNKGLNDYITPLIDLLSLLVTPASGSESLAAGSGMGDGLHGINAVKIFPYLSYILTGRIYPTGELLNEDVASKAKSELYWFLFSGSTTEWPRHSGKRFITSPSREIEPSFPYLRLILRFDAPSFLSAMNEAFEDSFLNDSPEKQVGASVRGDLPEEQVFGLTVDRQYIVSILIELMNPNEFSTGDTVYLDMFIARNLAKFPQYLIFPGSTLSRVLTGLCRYPSPDLAEDAQLSAEYLLSIFQPPDMDSMMPLFYEAKFYRILKRTYFASKQYLKLVQIYLEDIQDQKAVFNCLSSALQSIRELSDKQSNAVITAIQSNAQSLVSLDALRAAETFWVLDVTVQKVVIGSLEEKAIQYKYLKALLEPESQDSDYEVLPITHDSETVELYIRLMCSFKPEHVSEYVSNCHTADLHMDSLMEAFEESGVVDAALMLMASNGLIHDAMERLKTHLKTLQTTFLGLTESELHADNTQNIPQNSVEEILSKIQKYIHIGICLCNQQQLVAPLHKTTPVGNRRQSVLLEQPLSSTESMWLDLIGTSIQITKELSTALTDYVTSLPNDKKFDDQRLVGLIRSLVQHVFTGLLTATTSVGVPRDKTSPSLESNTAFLRILRAFLTQAATTSPNLADLRTVLSSIFSAYAYEESILKLSSRLLGQNLFLNVSQSILLRQRGWRPRGSTCEACGSRLWGPGVSGNIYDAWEQKQARNEQRRSESRARARGTPQSRGKGKVTKTRNDIIDYNSDDGWPTITAPNARRREVTPRVMEIEPASVATPEISLDLTRKLTNSVEVEDSAGEVVLLACRHIYHRNCLEALQTERQEQTIAKASSNQLVQYGEYICPIHS